MSGGWTPVFDGVFRGSLCGKWPDVGLWVSLLAMADRHGIIDATPAYIAAATGLPEPDVRACIERFCAPDPESRTPTDDGRRLVPLEGRGFGWKIVNHSAYRERARKQAWDADRTATGRDAARKRAERDPPPAPDPPPVPPAPDVPDNVPTCPDASRLSPLSNTNTNTNTEGRKRTRPAKPSAGDPLPEPWEVTETRRKFATDRLPGVNVGDLAIAFTDYHRQKGTLAKDWDAAWRTWVLRAIEFGYPKTVAGKTTAERREPTESEIAEARRKAAEQNAKQMRDLAEGRGRPGPIAGHGGGFGDVLKRMPK